MLSSSIHKKKVLWKGKKEVDMSNIVIGQASRMTFLRTRCVLFYWNSVIKYSLKRAFWCSSVNRILMYPKIVWLWSIHGYWELFFWHQSSDVSCSFDSRTLRRPKNMTRNMTPPKNVGFWSIAGFCVKYVSF